MFNGAALPRIWHVARDPARCTACTRGRGQSYAVALANSIEFRHGRERQLDADAKCMLLLHVSFSSNLELHAPSAEYVGPEWQALQIHIVSVPYGASSRYNIDVQKRSVRYHSWQFPTSISGLWRVSSKSAERPDIPSNSACPGSPAESSVNHKLKYTVILHKVDIREFWGPGKSNTTCCLKNSAAPHDCWPATPLSSDRQSRHLPEAS